MIAKILNLKGILNLSKEQQSLIDGGGTRHPRVCTDGTVVSCIPTIPGNIVECINGICVEQL